MADLRQSARRNGAILRNRDMRGCLEALVVPLLNEYYGAATTIEGRCDLAANGKIDVGRGKNDA